MPASGKNARYAKGKRLGSGSFGSVYLGRDSKTSSTVVVKEVVLKGLSGKDLRQSLEEVSVLKKLEHPNIIAYRDSYTDRTCASLCIVMEFAAGGDLGTLIKQRAHAGSIVPEKEVIKILAQAIDAMAYCHHEMHLLHRDLKPENILLTSTGDVKLADFGISRVLASTNALAQTKCG